MTSSPNLRVRRRLAFAPVAVALFGRFHRRLRLRVRRLLRRERATAPTARSSSSRTAAAVTRSPTPARRGKIGPNLDYAFLQSRRDGLGESTFVQVVRGQIAYPVVKPSTGAPGMPANILEGQDADDVASYVGSVAGVG